MNTTISWAVILLGLFLCFYTPKSRMGDRIWGSVTAVWLVVVGLALIAGRALPAHFV